jgi:hypothetical protein
MSTLDQLRKESQAIENRIQTRLFVMALAKEDAEKDFQFAMTNLHFQLKSLSPDQLKVVHDGLLYYAETGAARAFDALKLHGKLAASLCK